VPSQQRTINDLESRDYYSYTLISVNLSVPDKDIDHSATPPNGVWKEIDLNKLIENIYVAPTSSTWFKELVTKVSEKYGINKNVIRSSLDNEPFF